METVKIYVLVTIIIFFAGTALAIPPNMPTRVFGKVVYSNGLPVGGVSVSSSWLDDSGLYREASTNTMKSGDDKGYYYFDKGEIIAQQGSLISISSLDSRVDVISQPGMKVDAPDIIVNLENNLPSEKAAQNLDSVLKSVAAVLILANNPDLLLSPGENNYSINDSNPGEEGNNIESLGGDSEQDSQQEEGLENNESADLNNPDSSQNKDDYYPAEQDDGVIFSGENYSPVIGFISQDLYVCENKKLSYYFNITNIDKGPMEIGLLPESPFSVTPENSEGSSYIWARLYSDILGKEDIGEYRLRLIANDEEYVDQKDINIEVIEINNPPALEDIGIFTLETSNPRDKISIQLNAKDIEDGGSFSGNLSFYLEFLKGRQFFGVGSRGLMESKIHKGLIGFYAIGVCIKDKGIKNKSSNIGLCGQDGGPQTTCKNFSLTITEKNRPPEIVSRTPSFSKIYIRENSIVNFTIVLNDLDGTLPATRWYIDDYLVYSTAGALRDSFSLDYICENSKNHTIRADITDGLASDSVSWIIEGGPCVPPSPKYMKSWFVSVGEKAKLFFDIVTTFISGSGFVVLMIALIIVFIILLVRKIMNIKSLEEEIEMYKSPWGV